MDNFRRRPPMEGFSRPGSLGGEAYDDDSVEGHIMDDRTQDQDQDTEGQIFKRNLEEEDVEGHAGALRASFPRASDEGDEDTEGHAGALRATAPRAQDDEDTEGHAGWLKASEDDEDTEGHAKIR